MKKQSVADILNLLPEEQLNKIGISTGVDHSVSRLYGDIMLKLLIFGMLRSDRLSMRVLEQFYNSALFSLFSGKGAHQTKHSSLSSRLTSLKADYFAHIFQWCSQHFASVLPHSKLSKQLTRFDSTLCAISSSLVSWGMRVGRPPKEAPAQVQLKFSVGLTNVLPTSLQSFFDQEHLWEETALKEAIQKAAPQPADLVVFDLGLKSRQSLKLFDEQGIHFLTRGGSNLQYQFQQVHRHIKGRSADGLRFLCDSQVYLYTTGGKQLAHAFRLVEAQVEENGEILRWITNIWDLTAMDIARIYRRRWDIEVFFRFLKQELNIKHLLNHSENGIQIQIYSALITAILLIVYKTTHNMASYKQAKIRFEDELLMLLINTLKSSNHSKGKGVIFAWSARPAP